MSSRGKKKTTMAKLTRESRLRERRAGKVAKKEARRNAPPMDSVPFGETEPDEDLAGSLSEPQPASDLTQP
ncbi:MAG: hypothetical protein ACR2NR_02775 [Solirubrobacteraceae bacterium]